MDNEPDSSAHIPAMLKAPGDEFLSLAEHHELLAALDNRGRTSYRNRNAAMIATSTVDRLLIVAGPGSGKSHLFRARIEYWLPLYTGQQVYVSTFVRKLVNDLKTELDAKLEENERKRVQVSTLHTLARSVVERHARSDASSFHQNVRVIDEYWADLVWDDVLAFHPDLRTTHGDGEQLEAQFNENHLDSSAEWGALRSSYRSLCAFYNAVGFASMIHLATEALASDPSLVQHQLWIIDEFQDFNRGEDALIRAVTADARGVLLAGDDEQALYQTLKASTPDIICGYYRDPSHAKAMLPFCSRCSQYICLAAAAFAERHRSDEAIPKLYLPIEVDESAERVNIVATTTPGAAVDYIREFMQSRADEYDTYLKAREVGDDTDPFLLILSPNGAFSFSKHSGGDDELRDLVAQYAAVSPKHSGAYFAVLAYYSAGADPEDNFAVRKVLANERLSIDEVHRLVTEAMERGCSLADVVLDHHPAVIERMRGTVALVDVGANDPAGTAADLIQLLGLANASSLAAELESDPIGKGAAAKEDEEAIETAGSVDPVALMTMIGSKGLSAHHVIILGCDETHMAKTTALTFFVALTRARESLHLLVARGVDGSKGPHQFVLDLDEDCCRYFTYTKGSHKLAGFSGRSGLMAGIGRWEKGVQYAQRKK